MRAQVVEAYEAGQETREVAEKFGIGRTTVLKILKQAGLKARTQPRKHQSPRSR
ncbi:helix-turn-helix domain-containing protein [Mycolicibacterium sphagni]